MEIDERYEYIKSVGTGKELKLNDAIHNDRCKARTLISSNYQRCNSLGKGPGSRPGSASAC